jgi:hypothetical protein
MNRRRFLSTLGAGISAAWLFGSPSTVVAYDPAHRIRRTNGWTIDPQFGRRETQILTDALARFYERFLQSYGWGDYVGPNRTFRLRNDSDAWDNVTQRHVDHYRPGVNTRNIFVADWRAMRAHFVTDGKPFPPLTLRFINHPRAGFVAQAHYDMILINDFPNDTAYTTTGRTAKNGGGVASRGEFDIEINDWYLANDQQVGRHSSDPNYWAGVISHEAWHNLGHGHPPRRSDPNYYQHQMVLHEMCIMQNSSIRYGHESATPVYCRRHPG